MIVYLSASTSALTLTEEQFQSFLVSASTIADGKFHSSGQNLSSNEYPDKKTRTFYSGHTAAGLLKILRK
jgi:hypothetical protein